MGITLEDIAKRAGVTQAAVSEIVRNHPNAQRFREETRKRVLQLAAELNYRPHFFASQIRAENRKMAMLCVPSLKDIFAAEVAQAFEGVMAERGYSLMLSSMVNHDDAFYDGVIGPHGLMALAVVGRGSTLRFSDERLQELAEQGVKIVTIGRDVNDPTITQVTYDYRDGVSRLVDHLWEQGARRFWLLGRHQTANGDADKLRDRLETANDCLAGKSGSNVRIVDLEDRPEHEAGALIADALKADDRPDAVVCASDWLAWESCRTFREAGLTVGKDVAVSGFNDDAFSRFHVPSLTTIRVPREELGRQGGTQLIEAYEGHTNPGNQTRLKVELVIRDSSKLVR